jgi:hypothetical protein
VLGRRWAWLAVVAAAVVVAGVGALPWHRSGSVARNGFELARVADNLGLVSDGSRRLLFVAVFLLPLLAGLVLLCAIGGWGALTALCASAIGIIGLASSVVAVRVADQWLAGPTVTGTASSLAVLVGARLASERKHPR